MRRRWAADRPLGDPFASDAAFFFPCSEWLLAGTGPADRGVAGRVVDMAVSGSGSDDVLSRALSRSSACGCRFGCGSADRPVVLKLDSEGDAGLGGFRRGDLIGMSAEVVATGAGDGVLGSGALVTLADSSLADLLGRLLPEDDPDPDDADSPDVPATVLALAGILFCACCCCDRAEPSPLGRTSDITSGSGFGLRAWATAKGPAQCGSAGSATALRTRDERTMTGMTFSVIFAWLRGDPSATPKTTFWTLL